MKYLFYISFLFSVFTVIGQDQYLQIISKIDIDPQYNLEDDSKIRLMGFTEQLGEPITLPSPIITVFEGDSVELNLWNFSQGAPHTIHLHGLDVDQQNDGVPHLSFTVEHSEKKSYFFKAPHPGTYLYHCHVASPIHVQAGMYGLIIVKPKGLYNTTWEGGYIYDAESSLLMSEIDTNWHTIDMIRHHYTDGDVSISIPKYQPQYFLVNGKSGSQLKEENQTIKMFKAGTFYLRLANIGNYGNRVIIPASINAKIISSDGRPLPEVEFTNEIEVMPGERYGVLIETTDSLMDSIHVEYFNLNTSELAGQETINIVVLNTLNTRDLSNTIEIYPNPITNGWIQVDIPSSNIYSKEFQLFDLAGRIVRKGQFEGNKIDFQEIKNGNYILKIKLDREVIFHKVTIVN